MAIIGELGRKYPCRTDGDAIDLNNELAKMYPGEVLEAVYEVDGELNRQTAREIMLEVLKSKEEYPYFVLHYVKCETRTVTVQFSVAPVGGTISAAGGAISEGEEGVRIAAAGTVTIIAILAFVAFVLSIVLPVAIKHGWILRLRPRTGDASAVARDQKTGYLIPNVQISVSGQTGKTGPNGEAILFKDLTIGEHIFAGQSLTGYLPPDPVPATILEASITAVTVWYKPEDWVEPTHGELAIDTTPVKGEVWIGGKSYDKAPVTAELPVGEYQVAFGYVKGYQTPPQVTLKVVGGWTSPYVAYYTVPTGPWYEKYIKYGLIGGGVILGAALLVPDIVRLIRRRE